MVKINTYNPNKNLTVMIDFNVLRVIFFGVHSNNSIRPCIMESVKADLTCKQNSSNVKSLSLMSCLSFDVVIYIFFS